MPYTELTTLCVTLAGRHDGPARDIMLTNVNVDEEPQTYEHPGGTDVWWEEAAFVGAGDRGEQVPDDLIELYQDVIDDRCVDAAREAQGPGDDEVDLFGDVDEPYDAWKDNRLTDEGRL